MKFLNIDADIRAIVETSTKICGSSYETFIQIFSQEIDDNLRGLPPEIKAIAVEKARHFGYLSPAEINDMVRELINDGSCMHGLDENTCPCGCFEHDWNDPYPDRYDESSAEDIDDRFPIAVSLGGK